MLSEKVPSAKLDAGNRTYFFDLHKSVDGINYLKISELHAKSGSPEERHRLMIFEEHFSSFLKTLQDVLPENPVQLNYMERQKALYPNAYKPWPNNDDEKLQELFFGGKGIDELTQIFQRNKGAIVSRIHKLNLLEKYYSRSEQA